eukprot:520898_1
MSEQQIEFSMDDRSRYVRALYAFEANDNTQLTINPGDILEVFYRDETGWWDGKNLANNNDGYFPGNYTEALGDSLDTIKQELLYEDEEPTQEKEAAVRSSVISLKLMKGTEDSTINIRNAEPKIKRMLNEFKKCTMHCGALCSKNNTTNEYIPYIIRSLSIMEHILCIFGGISLNYFITSYIYNIY